MIAPHPQRKEVGVAQILGNILEGNIRSAFYVDDRASQEQMDALVDAFTGKLGGPLAGLADLVSEVVTIEKAPMEHAIVDGAGTLKVDGKVDCSMHPYRGPDGSVTTLNNSIFSTVPGSPAYVSKADYQKVDIPEHGYSWEFDGRNAIQSDWKIDYRGE